MNFPKRNRMFCGSEKKESFNLKALWKPNMVLIFTILPALMNEKLFFCSVSTPREECCSRVACVTEERWCVICESKKIKSFESERIGSFVVSNDSITVLFTVLSIAETELFPPSRKSTKQKIVNMCFCNVFIISSQM